MNIYEWICTYSEGVAVCKSATSIIASNIFPFIPIALVAIEGRDVCIDASEGDS